MNTITRVLHSIFHHRKDIVYRQSSSILISCIVGHHRYSFQKTRISYRKINLYECPFNNQRRIGHGVALVAILVKVRVRVLVNFFYLRFFILKNRHEEHKGHAMIFMCDKKCQTAIFGQRRWHQTTTVHSIQKADRQR